MPERVDYDAIVERVKAAPPGKMFSVPKAALTPRPTTWRRSIGIPYGIALRQWRDGVIHVHETHSRYYFHRDRVDPHKDPLGHLVMDAPGVTRKLAAGAALALVFVVRRVRR